MPDPGSLPVSGPEERLPGVDCGHPVAADRQTSGLSPQADIPGVGLGWLADIALERVVVIVMIGT